MRYVGNVWGQLQGQTAMVRQSRSHPGKVEAQFDARSLGFWAYRWHRFEAWEFEEIDYGND